MSETEKSQSLHNKFHSDLNGSHKPQLLASEGGSVSQFVLSGKSLQEEDTLETKIPPVDIVPAEQVTDEDQIVVYADEHTSSSSEIEISEKSHTHDSTVAIEAPGLYNPQASSDIFKIAPGGKIGRYKLIEQIGEGGMACIFRAQDVYNGRLVAVKMLHAHQLKTLAGQRFHREYRAIHHFSHPHIVEVYEYGVFQGQPYIAMEYIDGHDLKHHLTFLKARSSEERWREVEVLLTQICQALDYIHTKGIIHRDLKPSNILLTQDYKIKLTDFGVAKPQDVSVQLTQAGMLVGTLAYLAPEVFEQKPMDHRVDLYALGVMLYMLLVDKLPFTGKNMVQIMQKHLMQAPVALRKINPMVPEHLEHITLKLLEKKPSNRYSSAADVLRDLQLHKSSMPVAATEQRLSDKRWVPRFVGRYNVLESLGNAIHSLLNGQGGVWTVEGGSGSGKTRFVEVALSIAKSQGILVHSGLCLADYQDWGEGFRKIISNISQDTSRRSVIIPELMQVLPYFNSDNRPVPSANPKPPINPYENNLALLVEKLTSESPRIFFIDDVHHADQGTLLGIASICRTLVRLGAPILLILVLDSNAPVYQPLLESILNGDITVIKPTRLSLDNLYPEDILSLLESMYTKEPRVAVFSDFLYKHTNGNPLLLTETIRWFMARGRIGKRVVQGQRRWVMAMSQEDLVNLIPQVPAHVNQLISARMSIYPAQTRTLLRLLAVWGREIRLNVLLKLVSAQEEALLAHIDRLVSDGWLIDDWLDGEELYQLAHPVYRTFLLNELTPTERVRLRSFIEIKIKTIPSKTQNKA